MEVLADQKTLDAIKSALDDIKRGGYKGYADVKEFRAKFESKKSQQ